MVYKKTTDYQSCIIEILKQNIRQDKMKFDQVYFQRDNVKQIEKGRGYSNNLFLQFLRWQISLIDTYCLYFTTIRKRKTPQTLENTRSFIQARK